MNIIKRPRIGLVVGLSVVAAVALQCIWLGYQHELRRRRVGAYICAQETFKMCVLLYDDTGRLISNLPELQRSAYYPYHYRRGTSCNQLSLPFRLSIGGGNIVYSGSAKWSGVNWTAVETAHEASKDRSTLHLLSAYLGGERARLADVKEFQDDYIAAGRGTAIRACEEAAGRKALPVPNLKWDLPATQDELAEYIGYIKGIEGVTELVDAWGRPLRFTIGEGYLECRSAGPDGRFYTSDDLVLRKSIGKQ